jgi:hypothetical protein
VREVRIEPRRLPANVLLAALAAVALLSSLVQASPDTAWVRRYNGPDNGGDDANMVVADQAGNSYVTGWSASMANGNDWLTIKYLPNGDTAWVRRADGWGHGDDRARALAVDDAGNVIVTGHTTNTGSNINIATIKYDSNGNLVYVKEYDGADHGDDRALAVAVDAAGNAYVVGFITTDSAGYDWMIVKYLPNGDTAWTRSADGWGHGDDIIYDAAVDDSGNVVATGYTTGLAGNLNIGTIKSDPNGNAVYVKEYDGATHGEDAAYALAIDSAGNAYVTGASVGATSTDCVTIKYLPNGDTAWSRRYEGPANGSDYGFAIALDGAGNAIVTGYSEGATSGDDWLTIKYLPNGDTLWTRRADGWANADDVSYAVAVGRSGDCFVTGSTTSLGGNINYGTIMYRSDGSLGWVVEYDGPGAGTDIAWSVALDTAENVFVTGSSLGAATARDYATIKYAAVGGVQEDRRPLVREHRPGASIVSGSLWLASAPAAGSLPLLDAAGRQVQRLQAGANDVSRLAPGIYFVCAGTGSARRVVILP